MLKRHRILTMTLLVTVMVPWASSAAVPTTLAVDGVLKSASGGVVPQGNYVLTFAIYNAEKAKTPTWKGSAMPVKVQGGAFHVVIGKDKALSGAVLGNLAQAWIGVTVGLDGELPRTRLHATPYALSAATATTLQCSGCIGKAHLAAGSISADKVGFTYAGSKTKGGPADLALSLKCSGCVSVSSLKLDASMDLGAHGIKAKQVVAAEVVAGSVKANTYLGDGSKLTGITIPSGSCKNAGEAVVAINPDGSLKCSPGLGNSQLPADGIDEISNDLIYNQFVDTAKSAKAVPILDNNPVGTSSDIIFPDVGLAQNLTVQIDLTNSDLSTVSVELYDPKLAKYVLLEKGKAKGTTLKTTYPKPTATVSGDLATWIGKNPKGKWRLKVTDTGYKNNKTDGAINSWQIDIQTLSSKKIQVKGDLHVDGNVYLKKSLFLGNSVRFGDDPGACTAAKAGTIRFSNLGFQGCNGKQWIAFIEPGKTQASAMKDCVDIKTSFPAANDGVYWIDPNGGDTGDAFQVQCNMKRDGGGWVLGVKHWYKSGLKGKGGAYGNLSSALSIKGTPYKLSDTQIRDIIGKDQNFDVMLDQAGYNSGHSTGNYEYVLIHNYTAQWTWSSKVATSKTTTKMYSYRISDNALAWSGNLQCGNASAQGWGINCLNVASNNPQGGAGCKIKMGKTTNSGWHHIYMGRSNDDTYLYVCNGAQHSSSYNMNHRYWFRRHKK